MIIDRNWNRYDQRLTISYCDETGNRKIFQKYLHHMKSYEYASEEDLNSGVQLFDTWNNKKATKVFRDTTKYTPNEFDLLELMYGWEESDGEAKKVMEAIRKNNSPRLYCYDIECESVGVFPDPNLAEQKVTSIAINGPDLSCMVIGLHKLNREQIHLMQQRYLEFIRTNEFAKTLCETKGFKPKLIYQYFETEEDLLEHWFCKILPNIGCIAGWNNWRFDKKYLCNRIKRLFGEREAKNMIKKASPTFEMDRISWGEMDGSRDFTWRATHQAEMDYMELVKKYDFVLRPYESYSLDWVATHGVKAHKIKYSGTIQQLYERDPEWYYYYNAVDSLLVNLIHYRLKCFEPACNASALTLVPVLSALGQVALTTAGVFEIFYQDDKHVVYNKDEIDRVKVPYEGAFCGCVPGLFEWTVCDDFASLYPTQIITCNLSMENLLIKWSEPDSLGRRIQIPWTEEELEAYRKDENYFVSVMGNVYLNDKDYAFKKYQIGRKALRNSYKYIGWDIDGELIPKLEEKLKLLQVA